MFLQFCIVVAIFVLLLLAALWNQHKQSIRLKNCKLPIRSVPGILQSLLRIVRRSNVDFNPGVWGFQFVHANNRICDRERIYASCIFGMIAVNIFKPEHIEVLMNSHSVLDKSWIYKTLQPWLGNGLVTRSAELWKPRRRLLTPAFHFKILENFEIAINKHSFVLIEKLKKKTQEPWIYITRDLSLCTLDIIAETAMGVEINAQENEESEYVKTIKRVEELVTMRNMYPWLWSDTIFNLTPSGKEFNRAVNILHNFTRKVIMEKKKEMRENMADAKIANDADDENIYMRCKDRKPFLSLLLHYHLTTDNITEEDIKDEVNTFMFAGHDTTSVGLTWALYNLGLHSDIQEKLYNEIRSVFGEDKQRPVTSNDIKQMQYLDRVLKESLRLFPSIPAISRDCKDDFRLTDTITIPAKSIIIVHIYSVHHDPECYSNPEIFDSDRFLPENSVGRHPFAFIPFSAGPRNCIGQKFAMMEEKIVITNILRHFRLYSMDTRDKVIELGELVLRPVGKLKMQLVER